jgi:hypothetical protein
VCEGLNTYSPPPEGMVELPYSFVTKLYFRNRRRDAIAENRPLILIAVDASNPVAKNVVLPREKLSHEGLNPLSDGEEFLITSFCVAPIAPFHRGEVFSMLVVESSKRIPKSK